MLTNDKGKGHRRRTSGEKWVVMRDRHGRHLSVASPHAPLLIPDVGGADIRKVRATRAAMEEMGRWVWEAKPQTVVVISPHATVFYDAVGIMTEKRLEGDFGSFGYKRIRLAYDNDLELVDAIERHITADGLKVERIDKERARRLESQGARLRTPVPLYYLEGISPGPCPWPFCPIIRAVLL